MDSNVLQYLKDNLYIISQGSEFIVSNKFYRDIGAATPTQLPKPSITKVSSPKLTQEDYQNFIEKAEVPTFLPNGNGGKFFANRVSQKGFQGFKQAMSTTDEKVLLAACKWYYKQQNTSKVMIGTWFSEDIWVSCVADVKRAIEKRNIAADKITDYGIVSNMEESSSNMEQG